MLRSHGNKAALGVLRAAAISGALILAGVDKASASITATATVSTPQTSAPFDYTVTLHNTGDTNIGTLWFAWTLTPREYDFLPSIPTGISGPAGWVFPISHNATPGDRYGIEWYNLSGSAIAPGGSGTFHFTSNDSPTTLAGPAWFPGFQVTNSVVYIGFPETDPGYSLIATVVPEPATGVLLCIGGIAALARRRRRAC